MEVCFWYSGSEFRHFYVYLSHPGIRQAAAGVEGWQQSEAQVFGHMQELILVPLHVLTSLLQHQSHGVPSQQTSERANIHIKNEVQQSFGQQFCLLPIRECT